MELHAQLRADCYILGAMPHGIVLLHRNASVPWFILVPVTDQIALYQLPLAQRVAVEQVWNDLAQWVHYRFDCARVNVAAIGNLVPQLHLHVIGRRSDDPLWPGLVWGCELPPAQWSLEERQRLQTELRGILPGLEPVSDLELSGLEPK